MLDRKGFLFVVTVFLILTYILLAISVWVKAIETSERSYAEFYRQSTLDLTIAQITPEKVNNVSNMALTRALFNINQNAFSNEVRPGPSADESQYIRLAVYDMFVNGSANTTYFRGAAPADDNSSSMRSWVDGLNQSLLGIGLRVSNFSITDFRFNQTEISSVDYSFNMTLRLSDFANSSSVSRVYRVVGKVNLNGFVDPALVRESRRLSTDGSSTLYRQLFFYQPYSNVSSFSSNSIASVGPSVYGGQGWLYNPLASASSSAATSSVPYAGSIAASSRGYYILVGTYDDIVRVERDGPQFAGYIVTTTPTFTPSTSRCTVGTSHPNDESNTLNPIHYEDDCSAIINCAAGFCTDKPFIVANGFSPSSALNCPIINEDGTTSVGSCVLIQNNASIQDVADRPSTKLLTASSGIFNLEPIRDLIMCGYYIGNPAAPSYLQRLLPDSYNRSSPYGIETFIIGEYADPSYYNGRSRLDRELFGPTGSVSGTNVRGLPGCRDSATCSDSPITGIFSISATTARDYGLSPITCDRGARCG
ncbi:MAG: hypothetical protein ACP5N9_00560 [Candidatus Bilamarchaeum sp.]